MSEMGQNAKNSVWANLVGFAPLSGPQEGARHLADGLKGGMLQGLQTLLLYQQQSALLIAVERIYSREQPFSLD
jgi:hypothetical protein